MKRKALSSAVHSLLLRVLRLADFGRVVQCKFAEAVLRRASSKVDDGLEQVMEVKDLNAKLAVLKVKVSIGELENFKACLRHHRDALRETTNFLQYYNDRKVKLSRRTNANVCTAYFLSFFLLKQGGFKVYHVSSPQALFSKFPFS